MENLGFGEILYAVGMLAALFWVILSLKVKPLQDGMNELKKDFKAMTKDLKSESDLKLFVDSEIVEHERHCDSFKKVKE